MRKLAHDVTVFSLKSLSHKEALFLLCASKSNFDSRLYIHFYIQSDFEPKTLHFCLQNFLIIQGLFLAKTESDFWTLPWTTYFFQKFVLSKQL